TMIEDPEAGHFHTSSA
nr:Chain A, Designed peptide BH21 [synthetic construct]